MKNKGLYIFIIVAAVAVGIYLVFFRKKESAAAPAAGPASAPPMAVNGFVVNVQKLADDIEASGTLEASESVELHPELSARVIGIYFKEGTTVSKGQLLVKLYDTDLQAQLKKLQAQFDLSQKMLKRQEELSKISGVSQQEYETAQTQLNSVAADMDLIKATIQKTEIRAPFAGTIGLKSISEGAYVTPATIVASIQQTSQLKLDFSLPERYSDAIHANAPVKFTVDGHRDTFSGRIYAIEPKIDAATRNLKVRALCDNTHGNLLPGSFAKVSVDLKEIPDAMMIPTQAIIPEARGKKVVVAKGGKPTFKMVETGIRNENYVQIIKGLDIGDTVVITGIMQIRPNSVLKVSQIEK